MIEQYPIWTMKYGTGLRSNNHAVVAAGSETELISLLEKAVREVDDGHWW